MSFEQNLDPKYSISVLYWHAVVDVEYKRHCAGDFLLTGAREPTPQLSALDDDNSELPDLPIEMVGASWSAASPSLENEAPAKADEPSDQARRR